MSPAPLVFASDRADDLGRSRIYSVVVRGGDAEPVSEGEGDDTSLTVSRDRRRIAFIRTLNRTTNVWVAKADGSDARQITHTGEPKRDLAWSPNGRRLAFAVRTDAGCRRGIEVVNADGTGRRRVVNDALAPSRSPNGAEIGFEGETQSYGDPAAIDVVALRGGKLRRIAPSGARRRGRRAAAGSSSRARAGAAGRSALCGRPVVTGTRSLRAPALSGRPAGMRLPS